MELEVIPFSELERIVRLKALVEQYEATIASLDLSRNVMVRWDHPFRDGKSYSSVDIPRDTALELVRSELEPLIAQTNRQIAEAWERLRDDSDAEGN